VGVHSGKFAVVNGVSTMRQWTINDTEDNQAYIASNTSGGTGRKKGNLDWTGSVGTYLAQPPALPGKPLSFVGYTAPGNDTLNGTGAKYTGTAIVDSVAISWDWGAGALISSVINFAANGLLSVADGPAISDNTPPIPVSPIGLIPLIGEEGSGQTELLDVVSCTLNITAANKPYVTSTTHGITFRKSGNIDWNASIVLANDDETDLQFVKGDLVVLWLPTDVGKYWKLTWGRTKEFTGLTVNRESGDIIQMTTTIEMSGADDSGTLGTIFAPDGTQFWP
jgi:hypothetical protein